MWLYNDNKFQKVELIILCDGIQLCCLY